jgi:hypothetical protein
LKIRITGNNRFNFVHYFSGAAGYGDNPAGEFPLKKGSPVSQNKKKLYVVKDPVPNGFYKPDTPFRTIPPGIKKPNPRTLRQGVDKGAGGMDIVGGKEIIAIHPPAFKDPKASPVHFRAGERFPAERFV